MNRMVFWTFQRRREDRDDSVQVHHESKDGKEKIMRYDIWVSEIELVQVCSLLLIHISIDLGAKYSEFDNDSK